MRWEKTGWKRGLTPKGFNLNNPVPKFRDNPGEEDPPNHRTVV